MKTSHGTPRTRAAWASAHAWLPALPAVTPRAQPSPRAASLFSAPRTLNDPVRWRFSALSATAAPVRSLSVSDGSTGVSFATSATAARARATASAVTVCGRSAVATASVGQRDDGVDLDLGAERQRRDAERGPGRRVIAEERAVGLVDLGEAPEVDEEDREPDRVGQRRAGGGADGVEVLEAAGGLGAERAVDELVRRRVQRRLAGAEQQAARDDGVAV